MIALRPRDQHVWDPRPLPHETEAEIKSNYCETETEPETKKVVSRLRWSRDLNIPDNVVISLAELLVHMPHAVVQIRVVRGFIFHDPTITSPSSEWPNPTQPIANFKKWTQANPTQCNKQLGLRSNKNEVC